MADLFSQPPFVDRPDLLQKNDRITRKTAVGRHVYVRRKARFAHPARYRGGDDRRAVPVADVVLYDKYRTKHSLLGSDDRRKIRVISTPSCYLHFRAPVVTADKIVPAAGRRMLAGI